MSAVKGACRVTVSGDDLSGLVVLEGVSREALQMSECLLARDFVHREEWGGGVNIYYTMYIVLEWYLVY